MSIAIIMGMGESKMLQSNLLISEIVGFVERGNFLHVKQRKENGEKLKKEIRW
jgi:hypothetical protein